MSRVTIATGYPTHYVHCNSGNALFVKDKDMFDIMGGMTKDWGKNWVPVIASSIEQAREIAGIIFKDLISKKPDIIQESLTDIAQHLWMDKTGGTDYNHNPDQRQRDLDYLEKRLKEWKLEDSIVDSKAFEYFNSIYLLVK